MIHAQATTTINLDGATYEVANMSQAVKNIVQYLDDWRQREIDATSELLMIRAALKDIQRDLTAEIQKEKAAAQQKVEELRLLQPANEPEVAVKKTAKPRKKS